MEPLFSIHLIQHFLKFLWGRGNVRFTGSKVLLNHLVEPVGNPRRGKDGGGPLHAVGNQVWSRAWI
jgi:hypothetical protein